MGRLSTCEEERADVYGFRESLELERSRRELSKERLMLERQRKVLETEKHAFARTKEREQNKIDQERQLFAMKWKILEAELQKLAHEKQQVAMEKEFYAKVSAYEHTSGQVVSGELFFKGVGNEQALRKRYKDLVKIFHPDNVCGDMNTIQEINKEYDHLKKRLCVNE